VTPYAFTATSTTFTKAYFTYCQDLSKTELAPCSTDAYAAVENVLG